MYIFNPKNLSDDDLIKDILQQIKYYQEIIPESEKDDAEEYAARLERLESELNYLQFKSKIS